MRKAVVLSCVAAAIAVFPTSVFGAKHYYAGALGEDLPGDLSHSALIFKTKDAKVTDIQIRVRAKCNAKRGGPAPNTQLLSLFSNGVLDNGMFRVRDELNGSHRITRTIVGTISGRKAHGSFRSDFTSRNAKVCRTGSLVWSAKRVSKKTWKAIRRGDPKHGALHTR